MLCVQIERQRGARRRKSLALVRLLRLCPLYQVRSHSRPAGGSLSLVCACTSGESPPEGAVGQGGERRAGGRGSARSGRSTVALGTDGEDGRRNTWGWETHRSSCVLQEPWQTSQVFVVFFWGGEVRASPSPVSGLEPGGKGVEGWHFASSSTEARRRRSGFLHYLSRPPWVPRSFCALLPRGPGLGVRVVRLGSKGREGLSPALPPHPPTPAGLHGLPSSALLCPEPLSTAFL